MDIFWNHPFLICEQQIERLFSDHTSINRFVVSEAILNCLQLIVKCFSKNSILYSVNTDGFFITNPAKQYHNKKDVVFNINKIGRAYQTDKCIMLFRKTS